MKQPTHFGKRPILMQRYCGGLRIIYPDGKVEWAHVEHTFEETPGHFNQPSPCTQKTSQEDSYKAAIEFDGDLFSGGGYTEFLGYL